MKIINGKIELTEKEQDEWGLERTKFVTLITPNKAYNEATKYECIFCGRWFLSWKAIFLHLFKNHREIIYQIVDTKFHEILDANEKYY